jgi:hypothetical protein
MKPEWSRVGGKFNFGPDSSFTWRNSPGSQQGQWSASYKVSNFGQTPAHNVKLYHFLQIVDWNGGRPTLQMDADDPDNISILGSMAPGRDFFEGVIDVTGNASPAELNQGNMALYFPGFITYETTFALGTKTTKFRYYIGGDVTFIGVQVELEADDQGNDADLHAERRRYHLGDSRRDMRSRRRRKRFAPIRSEPSLNQTANLIFGKRLDSDFDDRGVVEPGRFVFRPARTGTGLGCRSKGI